jgi:mannose-6-phosphate isomerase-like protein (cupin superfamily)
MAKRDMTLTNTLTGEQVIFRKTAKDSHGKEVEFEQFLPPGRGQTAEHIHLEQLESFKIISGTAVYAINGVAGTAGPGETVTIPKNVVHINPRNASSEMLHMFRVVDPANGAEIFYETIFGLASDGKTNKNGFPNPFQMAVIFQALDATTFFYPRQIPIWLQKPVILIFAAIGRLAGFKSRYPKYALDD